MSLSSLSSLLGSSASSTTSSPISVGSLDVSSLVSQLMAVNSQPLTQLQSRISTENSQISAMGQVASALGTLQTAAQKLELNSAFQAASASVSGSSVTASVTGTPQPGQYNVNVSQLAQAQSIASAPVADSSTAMGTGTLTIQMGTFNATANSFTPTSGSSPLTLNIDATNNTPDGIASAINSADAGVTASVVTDASGSRVTLTSTNSGTANAFTVTGFGPLNFDPTDAAASAASETQTPADAKFSVNGLSLTSSSNTVTTAINGLSLNLAQQPAAGSAAGATANSTVTVGVDSSAVSSSVNSFVTAFNSLATLVQGDTAYNTTTNTGSVLTGNSSVQNMMTQLQQTLGGALNLPSGSASSGALSYLSQVGISFQDNGTLAFDSTTFSSALTKNPSAVESLFTANPSSASTSSVSSSQGFAYQITNLVNNMLGSTGLIGASQAQMQTTLKDMDSQQSNMQTQLAAQQTQLTTQYSDLNSQLSSLQNQLVAVQDALAGLS